MTEADVKFLKSLRIAVEEPDMNELTQEQIDAICKSWHNANTRWHEEHDRNSRPFDGIINGLVLSALIWVPVIIYFWRTR